MKKARSTFAFRPDVPSFGYALVLSINATSIWGGIFPYLPPACQNSLSTIVFYTVQIAVFWLAFCLATVITWKRPEIAKQPHVLAFSLPLVFGPLTLIGAMYFEQAAPVLIICAATLIGLGSALFLMSWQRVFAASDSKNGNLALIKGAGFSALLYFGLYFIPPALTAYLIPLVFVPLAGLCLWLAARTTSSDQPMFEDVPREHSLVYLNALRESILPALSIGALGFCSGAIRFIAVVHQELQSTLNIFSMFALLVVVFGFYLIWRKRTLHVDLMKVFRVLFPIVGTCLILLPFVGDAFADLGIGITYACFMLATVLMMMHCGQISRDSGINPIFIFAFYGTIIYFLQMCGYLVGYISGSENTLGVEQLSLVSLVALYVMLLAALFGQRVIKLHTHRLEFLMLTPRAPGKDTSAEIAVSQAVNPQRVRFDREKIEPPIVDRLSKRCQQLGRLYGLSSRETEIMELIARGNSGPAIAEMLFITENTMRTHSKRIYAKLDIHKKQELLVLIDQMKP